MVETELIMHQLTCNGVLEGIRVCMLGFPNRMLYPDFKARYAILGAAEIASSSDNKVAVYALMDKIGFPREKFQLGHTKVFFRAGALAGLEENRDEIVLKLVRWMQGQCYGWIRRAAYQKKYDQRELMKVCQRNFRKFQTLRSWGWFILIQKTRPLIGQVNLEQELAILEEKASKAYGAYLEQVETKKKLEQENVAMEEDKKALVKQLEAEQTKARKKYARSKPPTPPSVAPYPADKKERKKAQNRTAAFRYREKKKSEQDLAEEELEALADKN